MERAGQMVMQHIRLRGRCECLATRNEQGVDGFLLVLRTTMHVPAPDRVEMNYYFARKIREMLHTDAPIMLWIQDSKDASRVAHGHHQHGARGADPRRQSVALVNRWRPNWRSVCAKRCSRTRGAPAAPASPGGAGHRSRAA